MEGKDSIRCDYLIITDGKGITQNTAHLINDTLRTLTSQPKVLVRHIHDQGKQKDKIKCKKVLFLLLARVSFFQLVLNWLNELPGITNWNKQVLVLIQEQDTENGDRSDIDHAISEINKEKEFAMINWITSFNDITSWWSISIKFLFKVKSLRSTDDITYKLVFATHEMKNSKIARIWSDTLSSFNLTENDASELYIVRIINTTRLESIIDNHAGINTDYKSNTCALSIAMLTALIDLKVIKAKQITRTIRTKTKSCSRTLTYLINILFSFLFVLTCFFNLPFLAIYLPFSCVLFWITPPGCCTANFVQIFNKSGNRKRLYFIIIHNIWTLIMCCNVTYVLSSFNIWLSILIGTYTIVWPILFHNLLCKIGLEFGVVSLPLELWEKINFGFLKVLNRYFGTIREQACVKKIIMPVIYGLFTLIHIPVIILYVLLFLIPLKMCTFDTKYLIFLFAFYTNFALAVVFGIVGGILLLSKFYLAAIITIIISLYLFFFLCVLHTYCWLEHDLEYGILPNLFKKLDTCLQNFCDDCVPD